LQKRNVYGLNSALLQLGAINDVVGAIALLQPMKLDEACDCLVDALT
jgi:hypothetical protein